MDHPNDPLHGVTLKALLEALVARHGWPWLAARVRVRCFSHDPSVSSSLTFLRRTPWARAEVEALYVAEVRRGALPPAATGARGRPGAPAPGDDAG